MDEKDEIPVVGMGEGDVERVPEEHEEAEKLGEDERLPVPDVEKVGEGVVMPVVGMGEELGVRATDRDPEGDPEKDWVFDEEVDTVCELEDVVMPVVGMEEEEGVKVTVRDTVTLGVSEGIPVVGRALVEMEEQGEEEREGEGVGLEDGLTVCPAVVRKQENNMKRMVQDLVGMVQDLNDSPVVGMGTIGWPREAQREGGDKKHTSSNGRRSAVSSFCLIARKRPGAPLIVIRG